MTTVQPWLRAFMALHTLAYCQRCLRQLGLPNGYGSLAMFTAIRRASSLVSNLTAEIVGEVISPCATRVAPMRNPTLLKGGCLRVP